jgi:hypothetical protein
VNIYSSLVLRSMGGKQQRNRHARPAGARPPDGHDRLGDTTLDADDARASDDGAIDTSIPQHGSGDAATQTRRSGGGRGGGWGLRLVAVAGCGAAGRPVGSASARAAAPGSLAGLPLSGGVGWVGVAVCRRRCFVRRRRHVRRRGSSGASPRPACDAGCGVLRARVVFGRGWACVWRGAGGRGGGGGAGWCALRGAEEASAGAVCSRSCQE